MFFDDGIPLGEQAGGGSRRWYLNKTEFIDPKIYFFIKKDFTIKNILNGDILTNIYVFWKNAADPPAPWTRLTRTNNYIRLTSSTANHMSQTGASTHTGTFSGWSCSGGSPTTLSYQGDFGENPADGMPPHSHTEPSWSISSNNNNPPYYGLDIIYMDLATWEVYERKFPVGTILVSNNTLTESSQLARFASADGYYIVHASPGTIGGSSSAQNHRCQGTTGSTNPGATTGWNAGGAGSYKNIVHSHTIDLYTDSKYPEPRNLVTRLYEALQTFPANQTGIVAFVDGTPTNHWTILTGWADSNLKAGNSNPSLTGSDTHTQSISGSTSSFSHNDSLGGGSYGSAVISSPHSHAVSATLTANHVPLSRYLVPVQLAYVYQPPGTPSTPSGNTTGVPNTSYTFTSASTDPDGQQVKIYFNWNDGYETNTSFGASGATLSLSHTWSAAGTYNVICMAENVYGLQSGWSSVHAIAINTTPTAPSTPVGVIDGIPGTSYNYYSTATEPDGQNIKYTFEWGDSTSQTTTSWYTSGSTGNAAHSFESPGTYHVKAYVTDSMNATSGWSSELTVCIYAIPNTPSTPSGTTLCRPLTTYTYTASATDPGSAQLKYTFDWGDGSDQTVTDWYDSGETASADHQFATFGIFPVKVYASNATQSSSWSNSLLVHLVGGRTYCQIVGL